MVKVPTIANTAANKVKGGDVLTGQKLQRGCVNPALVSKKMDPDSDHQSAG